MVERRAGISARARRAARPTLRRTPPHVGVHMAPFPPHKHEVGVGLHGPDLRVRSERASDLGSHRHGAPGAWLRGAPRVAQEADSTWIEEPVELIALQRRSSNSPRRRPQNADTMNITACCASTSAAACTSAWTSTGRRNCVVTDVFRLRSRPGGSARATGLLLIAPSFIARFMILLRLIRYLRFVRGRAGVSRACVPLASRRIRTPAQMPWFAQATSALARSAAGAITPSRFGRDPSRPAPDQRGAVPAPSRPGIGSSGPARLDSAGHYALELVETALPSLLLGGAAPVGRDAAIDHQRRGRALGLPEGELDQLLV
jgi:hypothetical protein